MNVDIILLGLVFGALAGFLFTKFFLNRMLEEKEEYDGWEEEGDGDGDWEEGTDAESWGLESGWFDWGGQGAVPTETHPSPEDAGPRSGEGPQGAKG